MRAKNLSKGPVAFHNAKRTKKIQLTDQGEVYEFKDEQEWHDFQIDMLHFKKAGFLELDDKPKAAEPKPTPKPEPKKPEPKVEVKETVAKGKPSESKSKK